MLTYGMLTSRRVLVRTPSAPPSMGRPGESSASSPERQNETMPRL